LKISAKKSCFLSFEWKKQISSLLAPPRKILEKSPSGPSLEKYPSDDHDYTVAFFGLFNFNMFSVQQTSLDEQKFLLKILNCYVGGLKA